MFRRYEKILLILVLLISAFFRFHGLELLPYWAWDEGVNMNISWNLANGKAQWFCLTYPFIPHPPLFFVAGGILLKLFGNKLIVLRALTAFYGVLTTLILYLIGKEAFNAKKGMMMSFLFAVYPCAIFFNRMAFANNQLAFFYVLTIYLFLKYRNCGKTRYLHLSALSASLAVLTEYTGIGVIASILILCWFYEKNRVYEVAIITLSPLLIFSAIMLLSMPQAFIHDFIYTFKRFRLIAIALITLLPLLIISHRFLRDRVTTIYKHVSNFYKKIAYDAVTWTVETSQEIKEMRVKTNMMLTICLLNLLLAVLILNPPSERFFYGTLDYFWYGIFGLMFIKNKSIRKILITSLLPTFIITAGIGRLDHMPIPLYPIFPIGLVILLSNIYGFLTTHLHKTHIKATTINFIVFMVLSYPFIYLPYQDTETFILQRNPLVTVEDIADRMDVAGYVNGRVGGDDLTIADSHFTRLINGKTSVIIQSLAIHGKGLTYMAPDYGGERFVFNCSYKNAGFIIYRKTDLTWLRESCPEILEQIDNYRLYKTREFMVYEHTGGVEDC